MRVLQIIYDAMIGQGIEDADAKKVCDTIAKQIGGNRVYVSRSDFARRNREIVDSFRGFNHAALGDVFDLSPRQIRRIVDKK